MERKKIDPEDTPDEGFLRELFPPDEPEIQSKMMVVKWGLIMGGVGMTLLILGFVCRDLIEPWQGWGNGLSAVLFSFGFILIFFPCLYFWFMAQQRTILRKAQEGSSVLTPEEEVRKMTEELEKVANSVAEYEKAESEGVKELYAKYSPEQARILAETLKNLVAETMRRKGLL